MKRLHHVTTNQKEVDIAILISDRANIKTGKVIRDKVGYYIEIKVLKN